MYCKESIQCLSTGLLICSIIFLILISTAA